MDITGLGEVAKAIPPAAWQELVQTATSTLKDVMKPLTAITGGIGNLIEQRFTHMAEVQKVLLADGLAKVRDRIEKERTPPDVASPPRFSVLVELLDEVSLANEGLTRQMWINLLTEEIAAGGVHPEFVNTLRRLAPEDARLLLNIASKSNANRQKIRVRSYLRKITTDDSQIRGRREMAWIFATSQKPFNLSQTVLKSLQLIEEKSGVHLLTEFGEAFLGAVGEQTESSSSDEK